MTPTDSIAELKELAQKMHDAAVNLTGGSATDYTKARNRFAMKAKDYFLAPATPAPSQADGCQICMGRCGGVKGNENVIHGVVMCDYCSVSTAALIHAAELRGRAAERKRCHDIALAIDSGRGNEKEIAKAIQHPAAAGRAP